MHQIIVVLCAIFISQGLAQTTRVDRCIHSGGQLPLGVQVQNCTSPPCLVPSLQDLVAVITFMAPRQIDQMTSQLSFSFLLTTFYITVPMELDEAARTCNFLTTPCPISAGEIIQYRFTQRIEEFIPVGTRMSWELRVIDDSNRAVVWCFRLPVEVIQAPLQANDNP